MGNYLKEIAIGGVVVLESIALLMGIDGAYLSLAIGSICAVAGIVIGRESKK